MDHEYLRDTCLRIILLVTSPSYIQRKKVFIAMSKDIIIDSIESYEIVINLRSIDIRQVVNYGDILLEYDPYTNQYLVENEPISSLHENVQELVGIVNNELIQLEQSASRHMYLRTSFYKQSPVASTVNRMADILAISYNAFIEWIKQII